MEQTSFFFFFKVSSEVCFMLWPVELWNFPVVRYGIYIDSISQDWIWNFNYEEVNRILKNYRILFVSFYCFKGVGVCGGQRTTWVLSLYPVDLRTISLDGKRFYPPAISPDLFLALWNSVSLSSCLDLKFILYTRLASNLHWSSPTSASKCVHYPWVWPWTDISVSIR